MITLQLKGSETLNAGSTNYRLTRLKMTTHSSRG